MRTDRVAWVYFFWGSRHAKKLIDVRYSLRGLGSLQFCLEHSFGILAPRVSPSGPFPQGKGSQMHSRISSSKTYNDTYTHTQLAITEWRNQQTKQTRRSRQCQWALCKCGHMVQQTSCWMANKAVGPWKKRNICLLDKVISLFFLAVSVVCHTARCFFRTMWP